MSKKWVITAAMVFLGVVCGVMILNAKSHYSSEKVEAEISNHGKVFEELSGGCGFGATVSHTSVYQRVIDWYHSFRDNQKITPTQFIYFRSEAEAELCLITLYGKNNQIYEVKIESMTGAMQDALDLEKVLAEAFPKLPCKVTTSKYPINK